jgi:hypothetical protein
MSGNEEIDASIRPLLRLSREHIVRGAEEFSRQGDAHAHFQAAQQAHPASAGGSHCFPLGFLPVRTWGIHARK